MTLWLNHVTIDAAAAGSHTADPSNPTAIGTVVDGSAFTPTAGRLLVCIVAGPVTSGTPSGWTLPSGGSAVSTDGLYVFTKTAAGSDTLITGHNSSAYRVVFDFYEFPSTASFGTSASFPAAASGSTKTLSGLTGSNLVMSPICSPGTAGSFSFTGATKHVEVVPADGASRYADSNIFSTASSVGVAATSASHEQLVFSIAGLSDATAASATASLTLSGSASAAAAATATGSLSLSGAAVNGQPASGTGALALAGSATAAARVTASGSLTLSGSASPTIAASATGSLTLTGVAEASQLYGTDTSNAYTGLSLGGTARVFVTQGVAAPPFVLGPQRFEKAIAFPEPTLVKGRPTFVNNVVAKLAMKDRILVAGKDITWFRADAPGDTPNLVPGFELIEPFAYGPSEPLVIKRTNSLFERYGTGELKWLHEGARVQYQRVDADGQVVDYRGFITAVRPSQREFVAEVSGEISGRADAILMQQPLIRKTYDLGSMVKFGADILGMHLSPHNGPDTGLTYPNFGGVTLQGYFQNLGALSRTQDTQARALMPKVWGEQTWEFKPKDRTTVDFTMYPDGVRIDLSGLVDDLLEKPNTIFGNGVSPDGERWRNGRYPGFFQGDPAPYPFSDSSHAFGIGTTDADTDTGDGITVMVKHLVWMDYLADDLSDLTTYTADVAHAVNRLKDDAGLTENGIMTSAAWAALWDTDIVGYSPEGARIFPLAQAAEVRSWDYSSTGSIIGRNENRVPGAIRVDIEIDYGTVEKQRAIQHARSLVHHPGDHEWAGDIVLSDIAVFAGDHDASDAATLGPEDMLRARDIRPGMNGKIAYFDGSSVLVHVSGVRVGPMDANGARSLTLSVDTGARDVFDLAEALSRNRESRRSPYREWLIENRPNRPVRNLVSRDEFFGKSYNNVALRGGHWNVIPVIMGQSGTVNETNLQLDTATEFCYAVFTKQMYGPAMDGFIGSPFTVDGDGRTVWEQDNMQDFFEQVLLLTVQGQGAQPCGYGWRHGYDSNGDRILSNPLTGTVLDRNPWGYTTLRGKLPIVWLAIYPRDDSAIRRGRWFAALEDDVT